MPGGSHLFLVTLETEVPKDSGGHVPFPFHSGDLQWMENSGASIPLVSFHGAALARDLPNLDLFDADGFAGVDAITFSFFVWGTDGEGRRRHLARSVVLQGEELIAPTQEPIVCTPDATTACLLGGRFEVVGEMHDFSSPPRRFETAVMEFPAGRAGSDQAAFFESFDEGNLEVEVKMVDACGLPPGDPLRDYWVFYGGLTNAETRISVTQLGTGLVDEWVNPAGSFPRSEGRTSAFPCE